jgi:hypothetical protein
MARRRHLVHMIVTTSISVYAGLKNDTNSASGAKILEWQLDVLIELSS